MSEYFGIDVSSYQGNIDWAKAKKADVQFSILKATRKNNAIEEAFERNVTGCVKNGIPVGIYRYVYARTNAAAAAEAKGMIGALQGKDIQCGIFWSTTAASAFTPQ